jgi:tetratricopeptide (TPR) repeat protein
MVLFLVGQGRDGAAAWASIFGLFISVFGLVGSLVAAVWLRQRDHDRPAPVAVPRQLPGDDTRFTGRASDLAQLDAVLAERARARAAAAEIVVVSGGAGVGKTALAVHWAHRVRHQRFPDGDLYVNLRGQAPVEAREVLDRFLRTLGVPAEQIPPGTEELAASYRTRMQGRRVLVLLDNAVNAEQVYPLLPGAPGCLVVVTSRSRLSGLTTRYGARRVSLDPMPEDDALDLLRRVVGARVGEEPAAAAELARACGHLPLALRIVAERVATHPRTRLADLAGGLARESDRLDILATPDDDETTAVRRVFSWSYRALPPATARVFRLLGLHAGPDISVPAAAALAGTTTAAEVRRHLDLLADGHLLDEPEQGRYRLHDLLRIYATERAEAEETDEGRATAVRRVLDWYLHTAEAANRALEPHRHRARLDPPSPDCTPQAFTSADDALHWLDAERANLVAATRQAAEAGQHATAWQLPAALFDFFFLRKPWADWDATHQVGLASARHLHDRYGEARITIGLAAQYKQQGLFVLGRQAQDRRQRLFEESIGHSERSLAICREIGDRWGEAVNLVILSHAYRGWRRLDEALTHARAARAVSHEVGDRWLEAWAVVIFAFVLEDRGQFEEATAIFQQARELFRENGSRRLEGTALQHLGSLHRQLQRYADALDCAQAALAIFREINYQHGEAEALQILGDIQSDAGRLDAANEAWQAARGIRTRLDVHA